MMPGAAKINKAGGWTLQSIEQCPSTNDIASDFPAWHAVAARTQSTGRGRFGRRWESGEGGVWLSAVVPAPINDPRSKLMPLAAGVAVSTAMREFGASDIRLRWPNDVMAQSRKCAGILVDRFHADRCVVGIGVNVFNDPSLGDISLKGQVTRLMDLVEDCPEVENVIGQILKHLRRIVQILELEPDGPEELIRRLRAFWKIPTRVVVTVREEEHECNFLGVDREGRVLLESKEGQVRVYVPEEIALLREI